MEIIKIGILLLINIVLVFVFVLVQNTKQKSILKFVIGASLLSFLLQLLYILYPYIKSVSTSGVATLNLSIGEQISVAVDTLSLAFSIYIEYVNDRRLRNEYNTIYFDELTILNPDFVKNKASIVLRSDKSLPAIYSLKITKIIIYPILIKELFDDEDIFKKHKHDSQYVRSIELSNIKIQESGIKRYNDKTYFEIKKYNGRITKLEDILKYNATSYIDKTMIKVECHYQLINSTDKLSGLIEKLLATIFYKFNQKTDFKLKLVSCSDNHFKYSIFIQ